jgi:Fuc2NAc and GlcNAc transferase
MSALTIATALAAYGLARAVRAYALKRDMLDHPNARSSHDAPTPRGGGLAIVVAFYAALATAALSGAVDQSLAIALCGGLVVAAAGFVDDRAGLSAPVRLAAHFAAALWGLYWIGGLPGAFLTHGVVNFGLWGSVVALFGLVWFINLFNFMDGTDGLAGAEAIFLCLAIALFHTLSLYPSAAPVLLAAGVLGFLVLNWPPARLFMGDVGSGFLGFAIGLMAIEGVAWHSVLPWPFLICIALFATDASLTLARRAWRREKVWLAHRSHAYQWAARRFGSHRPVLLASILINLVWLLPCAFLSAWRPAIGPLVTLLAYAPVVALALHFNAGKAETPPDAASQGPHV